MSKKSLIKHINVNGIDKSWQELAIEHNIRNRKNKHDWRTAVGYWSSYKRRTSKNLPKILIFDIETTSLEARVWRLWNQNVSPTNGMLKSEHKMICWSAKWLFEDKIYSAVCTPAEMKAKDDERVVRKLWEMMDKADIIIAHYGSRFDIPMSNTRFVAHGLPAPSPYQLIDTKKVASKHFKFESNKLDYIGYKLGLGRKIVTDYGLWDGCEAGDKESLRQMSEYCDQDVKLLEAVYLILRPYIRPHPNVTLFINDNVLRCPTCGHDDIEWGDRYYTYATVYEAFKCRQCGSWGRSRSKNKSIKTESIALGK